MGISASTLDPLYYVWPSLSIFAHPPLRSNRRRVSSLLDLDPVLFEGPRSPLLSFLFPRQRSALGLVMEGGQFVYPGVDLGFERVIQTPDRQVHPSLSPCG
jgi:hypothetical protein